MPAPGTAATSDEAVLLTADDLILQRELRYDVLPPWGFDRPSVPELTSEQRLRRAIARYQDMIEVNRLLIEDFRMNAIRFPWQARHMEREIERTEADNEGLTIRLNEHRVALDKITLDESREAA